jgi:hypothetical protein
MLTPDCTERLENWKFRQAAQELTEDATESEREVIEALAALLGNSGWFDGNIGIVTRAIVLILTQERAGELS